jgi:hypothetical protein
MKIMHETYYYYYYYYIVVVVFAAIIGDEDYVRDLCFFVIFFRILLSVICTILNILFAHSRDYHNVVVVVYISMAI